ncbi:hypothetical protein [Lactiplantibacillus plantarum]|uniref:hypothetical protein n=1 Tax=Lactiplantibacillus plantarum TaxID=1590 RepID=UPI0029C0E5A3|nr:hypothetical protein [Lactiplantibacillus plantarum]WPG34485.1 hypothetical protein SD763_06395 [Lactiplantibacillus plantarum]
MENKAYNLIFNIPQSVVMSLTIMMFQKNINWTTFRSMVTCAYCTGVTLGFLVPVRKVITNFINNWLLAEVTMGASMGILMNFCMTLMLTEKVCSYFDKAHVAIIISLISTPV